MMVRSSLRGISRSCRVLDRASRKQLPFRHSRVESLEPRWVLSSAPTLAAISDVTLYAGAPLHLALDAFDADGDALSFSITSTNDDLTTMVPQGNRSMRISVDGFGDMIFELFEQRVPETTARIIELANSGFYDDLTFHRIIESFMIQGGDPLGTGSGGSGVDFDDEFHPELRHSGAGVLSMANSGDDTNDSQFFITSGPTRWLDFNHAVFGQLVEGENVRQAIAAVDTDSNDKPTTPVVMDSVQIFYDTENGVLMLSAPEGTTGEADVTVTVDDRPYLQPIDDLETTADTPVTFTIPGVDVEGDAIQYSGTVVSDSGTLGLTGDPTTGVATVTPLAGPGVYAISVTVTGDSGSDSQIVPVLVRPTAPTNLDLATSSDTGASSTDSLTNLNNTSGKELSIWVSGLTVGAEVMLYADGQLIGQLTATSTTALIVTNGAVTLADGEHVITAVQTLPNQSIDYGNRDETVDLVSPTSAALIITVDTTKPQITSTSVGDALAGVQYVYDVESDVEAAGEAHYELSVAPPGMLINSQTGKITWTPQASHGISQNVVVVVEDEAGNHAQQTFLIEINQAPVIWAIDNQLVTELDTLTVEVVAQEDNGDLPITFSLAAGAPEGAAIDAQTGLFTWTPTEAQGPGAYDITVVATDSAGAVAHKKFRVTVTEENLVPVLDPIADATTAEGQLLQIDVTATDPDLPANTIQYGLGSGAPAGAAIDPTTGRFTWTPGESFGGQTVPIVVRVTDSAGATDEKTFHITVTEVDDPPVFTPINAELTVLPGGTLRVQVEAFDPDVPTNPVRYALEPGAPEGVTLDPVTGLLIWEVPNDFPMGTVDVAVRATEMLDDQTPGLETVGALRVQVINPAAFLLDQTLALSGRTAFGRQVAREAVEALLLQTREPRVRFVSAPVTPPPASDPLGFQIASNLRGEEPTKPAKHKKDQSDAKPTEDESVEPANYEETAPTDYPAPDDMPESAEAIQELAPPEVLDATLEMLADEAVAAACEAVADEVAAGSTG